ncbi:hypothetical protein AFM11_12905 [Mycolicibacterium wolinskyi]|uniref:Uncharacterized protein n=1 Tax=Mycolicibacterium wolinskyi TaxID=59750 RepID=A0A132PMZ0_9MYCO|nr:hypothetical protein AFM11_12905 [Mycolicibacterium wolinskyi]
MHSSRTPRDHVSAVVAAHGALAYQVAQASALLRANAYDKYAAHLEEHRAELNVAIGELALWFDSFGDWLPIDVGSGLHAATSDGVVAGGSFETQLHTVRESLKAGLRRLLGEVADARSGLAGAGLPAGEITAYRRVIRLWAGEAIDVVAAVHRLALADHYIRRLGLLAGGRAGREGVDLLRRWMHELEEADREGELELAATCGYEQFVERYRAESAG